MKKSISIAIIIAIITSMFAITGIANAATTKSIYKGTFGNNSDTKSIIQGNTDKISSKSEKITNYKNSNKTLKTKSKKVNGKSYIFKIVQQNLNKNEVNKKYSEPSNERSRITEIKKNITNVNIYVTTPTIKGYKLKTSTKNNTTTKFGSGGIWVKTVNAPVNGTVLEKTINTKNTSLKGSAVSITNSKKKITVSYMLATNISNNTRSEKIMLNNSKSKYEKAISEGGSSQVKTTTVTLTYTKK